MHIVLEEGKTVGHLRWQESQFQNEVGTLVSISYCTSLNKINKAALFDILLKQSLVSFYFLLYDAGMPKSPHCGTRKQILF